MYTDLYQIEQKSFLSTSSKAEMTYQETGLHIKT